MPRINPGPRKGRSRTREDTPSGTWEGRLRLWVDVDGRLALGPGKVRLLDAIASTKSLAAAAKQLHMSYRLAWKHLQILEERTGITVLERQRGGASGGGTDLTSQGKNLLRAYHGFRRDVDEYVESACRRHFGPWSSSQTTRT